MTAPTQATRRAFVTGTLALLAIATGGTQKVLAEKIFPTTVINPGLWHHYAFSRYYNGVLKAFLDGFLIGDKNHWIYGMAPRGEWTTVDYWTRRP